MRKNAAAPKLVLLNEEDYPEELTEFFAYIRELDAEGGPHWARVDRGELERYLASIGARRKQEGHVSGGGQGTSPAGKGGRRKYGGIRKE
jgi:hypothetical protein